MDIPEYVIKKAERVSNVLSKLKPYKSMIDNSLEDAEETFYKIGSCHVDGAMKIANTIHDNKNMTEGENEYMLPTLLNSTITPKNTTPKHLVADIIKKNRELGIPHKSDGVVSVRTGGKSLRKDLDSLRQNMYGNDDETRYRMLEKRFNVDSMFRSDVLNESQAGAGVFLDIGVGYIDEGIRALVDFNNLEEKGLGDSSDAQLSKKMFQDSKVTIKGDSTEFLEKLKEFQYEIKA